MGRLFLRSIPDCVFTPDLTMISWAWRHERLGSECHETGWALSFSTDPWNIMEPFWRCAGIPMEFPWTSLMELLLTASDRFSAPSATCRSRCFFRRPFIPASLALRGGWEALLKGARYGVRVIRMVKSLMVRMMAWWLLTCRFWGHVNGLPWHVHPSRWWLLHLWNNSHLANVRHWYLPRLKFFVETDWSTSQSGITLMYVNVCIPIIWIFAYHLKFKSCPGPSWPRPLKLRYLLFFWSPWTTGQLL